ncbi:MAG TPA: hypothetical protein VJ385_00110 [Fibrobacteria bacterium]|nr:hypothetical protein [Fibrobacteria bacterium]
MGCIDLSAGLAAKWSSFRLRRRMRRFAVLLVEAREAKPELLRYLESLEMKSDNQARELEMLRWTLAGEKMADWDHEQDRQDWLNRIGKTREPGK